MDVTQEKRDFYARFCRYALCEMTPSRDSVSRIFPKSNTVTSASSIILCWSAQVLIGLSYIALVPYLDDSLHRKIRVFAN
jgi:hypothetical protein